LRRYQKKNGLKATGSADIDLLQQLGILDEHGITHDGNEDDSKDEDEEDSGEDEEDDEDEDDGDQDDDPDDDRNERRTQSKSRKPAQASGGAPAPSARGTPKVPPTPRSPSLPMPQADAGDIPARHPIQSWAYQLADIDAQAIAALDVDLVVVDYSADGTDDTAFTEDDTARMKERPSGGRKLVISYMSIGEAEDYRFYWQKNWKGQGKSKGRNKAPAADKPAWLDEVNPDWEGNYKVRYWDPDWQAVIMGSPDAYLDRIIAAGFDGVYLDIIDAFEYWRDEKKERPNADEDMIAFVTAISEYARERRPNFWIIPQNGEALLEDAGYRAVISAQGKEDIFYGQDGDGKANNKGTIKDCLDSLAYAHADGIPVLAIEYLSDGKKIAQAMTKLAEAGCTAYFGPRDLDKLAGQSIA
jgi:cysteinyl-tRNA synthetase